MNYLKQTIAYAFLLFSFKPLFSHQPPPGYPHLECLIRPIEIEKVHPTSKKIENLASLDSSNWTGYTMSCGQENPTLFDEPISYMTGRWYVPKIADSSEETICSISIAMDGLDLPTIEQLGTAHQQKDGEQKNYAWFSLSKEETYEIEGFPVNIGDLITTSIRYAGENTFLFAICNLTKKVWTIIPPRYTSSLNAKRKRASWIVEFPFLEDIQKKPFNYMVHFNECYSTISEKNFSLNHSEITVEKIIRKNCDLMNPSVGESINRGTAFNVSFY